MKKPRRFVRMFKPRFAPLVEAGTKLQTVRPWPVRLPEFGDLISLREWTGKPYRSKQRILRESMITNVTPITIFDGGVLLNSVQVYRNDFAIADGFKDGTDMHNWFMETHKLPFEGILIQWSKETL